MGSNAIRSFEYWMSSDAWPPKVIDICDGATVATASHLTGRGEPMKDDSQRNSRLGIRRGRWRRFARSRSLSRRAKSISSPGAALIPHDGELPARQLQENAPFSGRRDATSWYLTVRQGMNLGAWARIRCYRR